jgi:hypothetical protein
MFYAACLRALIPRLYPIIVAVFAHCFYRIKASERLGCGVPAGRYILPRGKKRVHLQLHRTGAAGHLSGHFGGVTVRHTADKIDHAQKRLIQR